MSNPTTPHSTAPPTPPASASDLMHAMFATPNTTPNTTRPRVSVQSFRGNPQGQIPRFFGGGGGGGVSIQRATPIAVQQSFGYGTPSWNNIGASAYTPSYSTGGMTPGPSGFAAQPSAGFSFDSSNNESLGHSGNIGGGLHSGNIGGEFDQEGNYGEYASPGGQNAQTLGMPTFGANLMNFPGAAEQIGSRPGSFWKGARSGALGLGMDAMGINPGGQFDLGPFGKYNPQLSDLIGLGTMFMGPIGTGLSLGNKGLGGLINYFGNQTPIYGTNPISTHPVGWGNPSSYDTAYGFDGGDYGFGGGGYDSGYGGGGGFAEY